MKQTREILRSVFSQLDERIQKLNEQRRKNGELGLGKSEIRLLGQMSLLSDRKVAAVLTLAQTADLDAQLKMDGVVKREFLQILSEHHLEYDEDSTKVWLPKGHRFIEQFSFDHLGVSALDPESALVSKAVKAPEKNKQLIREAIASGEFPGLVDRLVKEKVDLAFFAEE